MIDLFKKIIKKFLKFIIKIFVIILSKFSFGRYFLEKFNKDTNKILKIISHNNIQLNFYTPNRLTYFRANTFSQKEPETLNWIENFPNNSVFWDIGANVGIYSCYAAKKINCKVYAFEPSVFNLEILSKNISVNGLNKLITIFPLAITDKIKENDFNMSSINSGSAISTFGEKYKSDGTELQQIFSYKTFGLSMDDVIQKFGISKPDFIKIDVDGIEHLILKGGKEILKTVDEILIEVDEKFKTQVMDVKKILETNNFKLESKNQSKMMQSTHNNRTYNLIWKKIK